MRIAKIPPLVCRLQKSRSDSRSLSDRQRKRQQDSLMNLYHLRAFIGSTRLKFEIRAPSDRFDVPGPRHTRTSWALTPKSCRGSPLLIPQRLNRI